jgi:predicted ATP-grasp superfamily ATP-dependent carboligase
MSTEAVAMSDQPQPTMTMAHPAKRAVLVTDGDAGTSRTPLATVQALAAAGYPAAVTVSGPGSLVRGSRLPFRKVPVPRAPGAPFVEAIKAELGTTDYLTVLAASDVALLSLQPELRPLVDKAQLVEEAAAAGLPIPPTTVFESSDAMLAAAKRIAYPAMAKPALGHSATLLTDASGLARLDGTPGRWVVQPFLSEGMRGVAGVMWKGRIVASVHQRFLRTWPPDVGMACAAETVEPDLEFETRIAALLQGFDGIFQVDLMGGLLVDVNPRVYASLPLAVAAGVNAVGIYCDLVSGGDDGTAVRRARPGVFFRWLDGDVRHLFRQWRTGHLRAAEALSELRPRAQGSHAFQPLRDPGPLALRLRQARRSGDGYGSPYEASDFEGP